MAGRQSNPFWHPGGANYYNPNGAAVPATAYGQSPFGGVRRDPYGNPLSPSDPNASTYSPETGTTWLNPEKHNIAAKTGYRTDPALPPVGATTAGPATPGAGATQATQAGATDNPNDLTVPGPYENWWTQNQGVWQKPYNSEIYSNDIMNAYANPANQPQVSQRTGDFYNYYMQNMPTVGKDANFDAYYDTSEARANAKLQNSMIASGQFGSSVGADQTGQMYKDMEAQRARDLADYRLRAAAQNTNAMGLGGTAAAAADASSQAASRNRLMWAQGVGGIVNAGDQIGMARLGASAEAAKAAQLAKEGRIQEANNILMGLGSAESGVMGQNYGAMFAQDPQLYGAIMNAYMARFTEPVRADQRDQAQMANGLSQAMSIGGGMGGGGGGMPFGNMGGGGGGAPAGGGGGYTPGYNGYNNVGMY